MNMLQIFICPVGIQNFPQRFFQIFTIQKPLFNNIHIEKTNKLLYNLYEYSEK